MKYTIFAFKVTKWELEHALEPISHLIAEADQKAVVAQQGIYVLSPIHHRQLIESLSIGLRKAQHWFVSATIDPDQGEGQAEFFVPKDQESKWDSWE